MGYVIPMLVCRDVAAEIEFCRQAFAAVELSRRPAADGGVIHATLQVGAALVMVHDEQPHLASRAPEADGSSSVVVYLYCGAVDPVMEQATAAGARVLLARPALGRQGRQDHGSGRPCLEHRRAQPAAGDNGGQRMNLSIHIDFNGDCEEAFVFYASELGGRIESMLHADPSLDTSQGGRRRRVVHASLFADGMRLAGADVEQQAYQPPRGFHLLLNVDTAERVHALFYALQAGGQAILAPQRTFWSPCYAIVVDRFGVSWKLNCVLSA